MKLDSLVASRPVLAALCGVVFTAGLVAIHARADEWDKKTVLTVNQPVQIRDTLLEPGQYVLKLYDSPSDRHTVQIFDRDQTHIINTVLAIPKERMQPAGKTEFTFWETPPGSAKALRDWFYPGDTIGQEFPYPKHLQQIAMAQPAPTFAPEPAPAPSTQEAAPPEAPAQSQAAAPEPAPEPQPEIAQNVPPAGPPEPQAAPEPPSAPEPSRQLPKTGSPYPLIGLSGALMLGLSGLLRLKRRA